MIEGFEYPAEPHQRRHGPGGYTSYESYRPWLRDEFLFRCVYCLNRERWHSDDVAFNIDHFVPMAVSPQLGCKYSNLLYACARCNRAKTDIVDVPDPCQIAFGKCLTVRESGVVEPLNGMGIKLTEAMALNASKRVENRSRWMKMLMSLRDNNPTLYQEYMGFPSDLDDLRPPKLKPKTNSLPDSVENCFYVQREQGRLAATY